MDKYVVIIIFLYYPICHLCVFYYMASDMCPLDYFTTVHVKWVKVNVNCPELLLIGKTVLLVRLLKVTHSVTNCVWTFGSILSSSDVRSTLGPWSRRRDMDLNHIFDFVLCCFFLLQFCEFSQSLYVAKVSYFYI